MKNILFVIFVVFSFINLSGCQTIKNKTDVIVEKENQMLSKYIGRTSSELKKELGNPDEDYKNDKGNFELLYKTKKYGIPCERKFEINASGIIVGFTSSGCI